MEWLSLWSTCNGIRNLFGRFMDGGILVCILLVLSAGLCGYLGAGLFYNKRAAFWLGLATELGYPFSFFPFFLPFLFLLFGLHAVVSLPPLDHRHFSFPLCVMRDELSLGKLAAFGASGQQCEKLP
jgi:hypothetical protein